MWLAPPRSSTHHCGAHSTPHHIPVLHGIWNRPSLDLYTHARHAFRRIDSTQGHVYTSAASSALVNADAGTSAAIQPQVSEADSIGARLLSACLRTLKVCQPSQCIDILTRAARKHGGQAPLNAQQAQQLVQHLGDVTTPSQGLAIVQLLPPSARLYHTLLLAYGRKGNLRGITLLQSEALRDSRLTKDPLLHRYTLLNTITAFGTAKRPDLAVVTFRTAVEEGIWQVEHRDVANALLNALVMDVTAAHDMFEELVQVGVVPNIITYNTLLKSCMRCSDANRAAVLWSDMQRQGVGGDAYTYTMLIKTYAYSHDVQRLTDMHAHMEAALYTSMGRPATALGSGVVGISGSHHTMPETTCAPGDSRVHSSTQNSSASSSGNSSTPPSSSSTATATTTATTTTEITITEITETTSSASQGTPPWLDGDVWGSLIVGYGSVGHTEAAWAVWRSVRSMHPGFVVDTGLCNAIMIVCLKAMQHERALDVFDDMHTLHIPRDVRSYNIAIKACGVSPGRVLRAEGLHRAMGYLRDMQGEGLQPTAVTYTSLCNLCAQARDGTTAWQLWHMVRPTTPSPTISSSPPTPSPATPHPPVRLDTPLITAMLKALGTAKMIPEAMTVFKTCVWGPRRCRPNRRTYVTLMRACREAGALQDAFSVYHGMRVVGLRPDNKQFQQLLSACADVVVEDAHGEAGGRNASGLDVERQVYPALYATFLQGPVDLDLHGLSVREARVAVLTVLRAAMHAYKRGQRGKRRKVMLDDFVIITGSGQHSGEQGPRLRDEILRLLQQELGIVVMLAPARSGPRARVTATDNPGRLVVQRNDLLAWLQTKAEGAVPLKCDLTARPV